MDNLDKITYDEIKHHGIKGQKWGVRRYQNEDGSLTAKGKQRYGTQENFERQYPQESKKKMKKAKGEVDVYKDAAGKAKRGMEEGREKQKRSPAPACSKAPHSHCRRTMHTWKGRSSSAPFRCCRSDRNIKAARPSAAARR